MANVRFSPGQTNRAYSVEADEAAYPNQPKLQLVDGNDGTPVGINAEEEPRPTRNRWTIFLVYCCFCSVIGSTFMFGYNAVVINLPADTLRRFINDSYINNYGSIPEANTVEDLWTWTVSLFLVGGTIGGLIGGIESDKMGRKRGLIFNALIGVISGVLMFMAPYVGVFELLMVGRFLAGIQCGSVTAIVPAYLTEMAPLSLRGAAGSLNQFSIVVGGFTASVLGLPVICGQDDPNIWPFLFFPCLFLPALQIVVLVFAVESPRWLVFFKRDDQQARIAVRVLREREFTNDIIEKEVEQFRQERETQDKLPKLSFAQAFIGTMGWPFVVCVLMQFAQQLSGINAVIYYSTDVYKRILEGDAPAYASLGTIATTVIMTILSTFAVERMGRRALMIIGLGVMWLDCILIVIFMTYAKEASALNYCAMVCFFIFVGSFNFGPGPIPWFIAPELTQPQFRPMTIALCTFANWLANLANGLGFPPIEKALGTLSFLPFLGLLTAFLIYTILFLPETKGLSAEASISRLSKRKLQLNCGPCASSRISPSPSDAL